MSRRVMLLIDKLTPGGAQRHAANLGRQLRTAGLEVTYCCLDRAGEWGEQLAGEGFAVEVLGISSIVPPAGLRAIFRLRSRLRENPPDILHTLLFSANVIGPLAARLAGGVGAVITARRDTGFWLRRRHGWALRRTSRWADAICANSNAVLRGRVEAEGLDMSRARVIYNSVEVDNFARAEGIRAELGLDAEDFVAVCVARCRPEKGHETLLRAAHLLRGEAPRLRLLFAGDGPEAERLRRLAGELEVGENVLFLGHRADVPALIASANVAVLVSTSEGFSNFVLEAMAAGKPVIASAVGGNREAVGAHTGILVPPGDPQAVATAFRQLRDAPETARRLGAAGQARARELYTPERELNEYLALYEETLRKVGK